MLMIKFIFLLIISTVWFSCEKDLNISDFKDEFGNYQAELKIEGLLHPDKPEDSIIRIIKTSVITDNDLYNGIDDDGDGDIDEYDEILPLAQDTSAAVKVINLNSGDTTRFQYVTAADSIIFYEGDEDESDEELSYVSYGGYKPAANNFQIEIDTQYKIEIHSREFDKTITGITTVNPAVQFIDTLYSFQDSIVTINAEDTKEIFWKSDLDVTSYNITFEELFQISANEWESEFLWSHVSTRDNELTERYGNISIGREIIWWADAGTILKMTVEALSPEYGRYILSDLPLKDPLRSNLRDEDGNPIMGCFGSIAANSIYIVIEE